jgi:Xaa-Pro aminopeptidase
MKTDLDSLMESHSIDAILLTGPAAHNPPMYYMTGGGHLTQADLIKKRGADPVLYYNAMERDEAAKTGLPTKNLDDYHLLDILKQCNGDVGKALAWRYKAMLSDHGVTSGNIAVAGKVDAGRIIGVLTNLQEVLPAARFIGQLDDSIILQAMATKDADEVGRIRRMGAITTSVVGEVAEFLTSHSVINEVLVTADGVPLTIGDVKLRINLWLAERGVENPEGTIFAIGRDAGVPHSSGTPTDAIRLGQTIVFDIFPCEAGGGYFYDFTRTWCLGYATDDVLALYEDVLAVYLQVMEALELGVHCIEYQRLTCDLFSGQGHPTSQDDPTTQVGYVHSLGHGVGLNVHERPWFGRTATPEDRLAPGVVFTIEPGLYYPEQGLGIRLEDTVWARSDGQMEVLADYPLDLVLPMK